MTETKVSTNDKPQRPSSGWSPRRIALVAAPLAALAFLAITLVSRNSEAVAAQCVAAKPLAERLAPLARGELAAVSVHSAPRLPPELAFTGPQGEPLTLADFGDRTVLLNLWATWCAPCREEMPALDRLQAELGGEDFEVMAINVDTRNVERPREWLAEHGIDDLAYYAENAGTLLQVLQRSGHVVGLPTTVLFAPNNCEVAILKGPAEWASDDAFAFVRAALGRE